MKCIWNTLEIVCVIVNLKLLLLIIGINIDKIHNKRKKKKKQPYPTASTELFYGEYVCGFLEFCDTFHVHP